MTNNLEMIFQKIRKDIVDEYSQKLVESTFYYQKKYGFELNTKFGHEHATWNAEADAFKHAFGSALIAMDKGNLYSAIVGLSHEYEYLRNPQKYKNPKDEKKMDLHNNKIGLAIAKNIKKQYADKWNKLSQKEKEDIIADKVWKHMQAGDLILSPDGRRKLKEVNVNENKKSDSSSDITTQCVGSYPVSGYNRADGVEVKGYTRTCGAKHAGIDKENIMEKYKNRKAQDMSNDEITEFLSAYFS